MEMRFSIAADRKSLDPAGLKYEMGDFDGYALEVALQRERARSLPSRLAPTGCRKP
jgi:electron transfer flavoprotein alpha/beta subunit